MTIRFGCTCGKRYEVRPEYAGRKLRCAGCQTVLIIPETSTEPEPRFHRSRLVRPSDRSSSPAAPAAPAVAAAAARTVASAPRQPARARSTAPRRPERARPARAEAAAHRRFARAPQASQPRANAPIVFIGLGVLAAAAVLVLALSGDAPPPTMPTRPTAKAHAPSDMVADVAPDRPLVAPLKLKAEFPAYATVEDLVETRLLASGGVGSYTYRLTGEVPPGVELKRRERSTPDRPRGWYVTGLPEEAGEYAFAVVVEDGATPPSVLKVAVTLPVDEKLVCTTAIPKPLRLNDAFAVTLEATGGKAPYTYRLGTDEFPPGVSFDLATRRVAGTPTEVGSWTASVIISDARGRVYERPLDFQVRPAQQVQRPRPGGTPGGGGDAGADRQLLARLNQMNARGVRLLQAGRREEAIKVFEEMLKLDPENMYALYNLACTYSLMGRIDRAIEYFEKSVRAGFDDFQHISKDNDLDNIRNDPRFKAIAGSPQKLQDLAVDAKLKKLKRDWPESRGYHYRIDRQRKLIFATNQSQAVLDYLVKRLTSYAEVQWATLFKNRPGYYLTIILPNQADFAKVRPNANVGGWYSHRERRLIAGNIGHTLRHEFTHALHFADIGVRNVTHNIWLVEGLATCFEDSELLAHAVKPVINKRLTNAQQAMRANALVPWRTFLKQSQQQFLGGGIKGMNPRTAGIAYAQCRYIAVWLYETGKLREFYDLSCELRDGIGIRTFERLFGESLEAVEQKWRAWLSRVPPFNPNRPTSGVLLGVRLSPTESGMKVNSVSAGSPAQQAGIRVGDIFMALANRNIDSMGNLVSALNALRPGDRVVAVIQRDGDVKEVTITLGARR